ncbi:hypothetical protein PHET_01613 [Paragonimus heterotremus]|uniref:Uncharacterized protein n=1 Tax=Paragonimus heterotremus TaxID=100268 RepID=A0A8J4T5B1_9TREM|nr:hypothetical protein PHET_01613 [Paragonimus heterotremus]
MQGSSVSWKYASPDRKYEDSKTAPRYIRCSLLRIVFGMQKMEIIPHLYLKLRGRQKISGCLGYVVRQNNSY